MQKLLLCARFLQFLDYHKKIKNELLIILHSKSKKEVKHIAKNELFCQQLDAANLTCLLLFLNV